MRKSHGKDRSFAWLTVALYLSADGLRHQVVDYMHSKARPTTSPLCGEKRIIYLLQVFPVHLFAIVGIAENQPVRLHGDVENDFSLIYSVEPVNQGMHHKVGNDLGKRARRAVELDVLETSCCNGVWGLVALPPKAQKHLVYAFFQEELSPLGAGLVRCHLFEAAHKLPGPAKISQNGGGGHGYGADVSLKLRTSQVSRAVQPAVVRDFLFQALSSRDPYPTGVLISWATPAASSLNAASFSDSTS